MTSDGLMLLRMLEPPVRPDGVSAGRPPLPPIESRGFESILAEAKEAEMGEDADSTSQEGKRVDPLQTLAQLDLVENGDVRHWLAGRGVSKGELMGQGQQPLPQG